MFIKRTKQVLLQGAIDLLLVCILQLQDRNKEKLISDVPKSIDEWSNKSDSLN